MLRTMDFTWLAQKKSNPGAKWIDSPVSIDLAKSTKPGVVGSSGGNSGSGSETETTKSFDRNLYLSPLLIAIGIFIALI